MNRKKFIKGALGTLGAFTIVPRRVLGGTGYTAPSDQLTKAVIGVGSMGMNHLTYPDGRLLAVCDVDKRHLQHALNQSDESVDGYRDYRKVLNRSDIDIVHIATPPHWHGIIAAEAAAAGKDIWCEKPMTRTIGEGEKVKESVQSNGSIFRINTWFRFRGIFYGMGTPVKPIKKLVKNRVFGWPLKVTINASTGFDWKLGMWSGLTDLEPQWIPKPFAYDTWLGPAPTKYYNQHRTHVTFRGYWDYDGGGLGDMGQHYMDPVQYFLEKDHDSPVHIKVDTEQQHPDAVSPWRRVELSYADGCKIILDGENRDTEAAYIEGPKGKLYRGFQSDIPNIHKVAAQLPDPEPQVTDFSKAVKERKKFALNEENGHRSCTLVNLAKIAVRLGRNLDFDPQTQRFVDDAAANRLISQPMRAPWHI